MLLALLGSCSKHKKSPIVARYDLRNMGQERALKQLKEFKFFSGSDIRFEMTSEGDAILIHCTDEYKRNEALKVLGIIDAPLGNDKLMYIEIQPLSIEQAMKLMRDNFNTDDPSEFGVSAQFEDGKFHLIVIGSRDKMLKAKAIIKQAQQVEASDSAPLS